MPSKLSLPIPPTPGNAAAYAGEAVAAAMEVDRVALDYTVESLAAVDRTLGEFRLAGVPFEVTSGATFALGCYLGEVVIRAAGGRWAPAKPGHSAGVPPVPLVVELPDGRIADPIGEAFRRVASPADGALAEFAGMAALAAAPDASAEAPPEA
jgi:hypothetical protein